MIAVFGNRYWVPGLANLLMQAVLLFALFGTLRRRVDADALAAAALVFFGVAYATTVFSFELWSALLGEGSAALLVAVAVVCWSVDPRDRRRLVFASLLLSLAALGMLAAREWRIRLAYAVLLAAFAVPNVGRMGFPLREASLFQRSERLDHLLATAEFLGSRGDESALAAPSWQSVIDLEYLLPGVGNFGHFSRFERDSARRHYLLTVNTLFNDEKNPWIARALDRCDRRVLDLAPYRVFECHVP